MDNLPSKLNEFPGLVAWFRHRPFEDGRCSPAERFVWKTCIALTSPGALLVRQWTDAFAELIEHGDDPREDFLEAKQIIDDCGAGLLELLGELGHIAFETNQTESFLNAMTLGAENTSLAVLRFMCAWTAFNRGDLLRCVEDCEKVDEPFSSVLTLQGQALLELGKPREAIDCLNMAVRLDANEIVAWFQLAKAYHVIDQHRSAWMALSQCRHLAPNSAEVALFCAMVALADDSSEETGVAYELLSRHMNSNKHVAEVWLCLLRLAQRLEDKSKFMDVVEHADWSTLREDPVFLRTIPEVLRDLESCQWMDMARSLLVAVTADMAAIS